MSLSNETLALLARIRRMPEYSIVRQLIDARLAEADRNLRRATGEELIRQQGRAQALEELIKDFDGAEKALQRTTQLAHRPARMVQGVA